MAELARWDATRGGACPLLLVLFFVFLVVQVIRYDVQMDGMRLRDFELGFALGTTQDLAFLDFVFIHIDFGGTFRNVAKRCTH